MRFASTPLVWEHPCLEHILTGTPSDRKTLSLGTYPGRNTFCQEHIWAETTPGRNTPPAGTPPPGWNTPPAGTPFLQQHPLLEHPADQNTLLAGMLTGTPNTSNVCNGILEFLPCSHGTHLSCTMSLPIAIARYRSSTFGQDFWAGATSVCAC